MSLERQMLTLWLFWKPQSLAVCWHPVCGGSLHAPAPREDDGELHQCANQARKRVDVAFGKRDEKGVSQLPAHSTGTQKKGEESGVRPRNLSTIQSCAGMQHRVAWVVSGVADGYHSSRRVATTTRRRSEWCRRAR